MGRQSDPRVAEAIDTLRSWQRRGAPRIDRNRDNAYEDETAIAILDAWWPKLLEAEFKPVMGEKTCELSPAGVLRSPMRRGGLLHVG